MFHVIFWTGLRTTVRFHHLLGRQYSCNVLLAHVYSSKETARPNKYTAKRTGMSGASIFLSTRAVDCSFCAAEHCGPLPRLHPIFAQDLASIVIPLALHYVLDEHTTNTRISRTKLLQHLWTQATKVRRQEPRTDTEHSDPIWFEELNPVQHHHVQCRFTAAVRDLRHRWRLWPALRRTGDHDLGDKAPGSRR
jgi:hypothetical protein